MPSKQNHVIHSLRLELNLETEVHQAKAWQYTIKEWVKREVVQKLDSILHQYAGKDEWLSIDKLEIDLGQLDGERIKRELDQRFLPLSRKELQKVTSGSLYTYDQPLTGRLAEQEDRVILFRKQQKLVNQFFTFLHTGTHETHSLQWEMWEAELQDALFDQPSPELVQELVQLLATNHEALLRFSYQFSKTFHEKLLEKAIAFLGLTPLEEYQSAQGEVEPSFPVQFQALIAYSQKENSQKLEEKVRSKIDTIEAPKDLSILKENIADTSQPATQSEVGLTKGSADTKNVFFIKNAGLVLILPLVKPLLKNVGLLTKSGEFISEETQVEAIHLIQYLATGTEGRPENEQLLTKMVCGMDLSTPIVRDIHLSSSSKEEADRFLSSIISQIPKLKNTSIDGFRESFLRRNGKLEKLEKYWKLIVEQESYDPFLINELAWSYHIIKFSWMKQRIHTEWI